MSDSRGAAAARLVELQEAARESWAALASREDPRFLDACGDRLVRREGGRPRPAPSPRRRGGAKRGRPAPPEARDEDLERAGPAAAFLEGRRNAPREGRSDAQADDAGSFGGSLRDVRRALQPGRGGPAPGWRELRGSQLSKPDKARDLKRARASKLMGSGSIREQIERLTPEPREGYSRFAISDADPRDIVSPEEGLQRAEELLALSRICRAEAERISGLTLEHAFAEYLFSLTSWNPGRVGAMLMRIGVRPEGPATLRSTGKLLGVSRERVRQLTMLMHDLSPSHPVFLPQLDIALKRMDEATPLSLPNATRFLMREGIAQGPIHPSGLARMASFCGRSSQVELHTILGNKVAALPESVPKLKAVLKAAQYHGRMGGASTVNEVRHTVARTEPEWRKREIKDLLQKAWTRGSFVDDKWFLVRGYKKNRIAANATRMLSVYSPQSAACLRRGLGRALRFPRKTRAGGRPLPLPPSSVLLEYFGQNRSFRVGKRGLVHARESVDPKEALSPAVYELARIVQGMEGGISDRHALLRKIVTEGQNVSTASVMMTYSGCFERLGPNMWSVRGLGHVEDETPGPNPKRTIGYYRSKKGSILVAYRIAACALPDFPLSLPEEVGQEIADRSVYSGTIGGAGSSEGNLEVRLDPQNGGWRCDGLGNYLSAVKPDEGDIGVVNFSLEDGTAELSVKRLESPSE